MIKINDQLPRNSPWSGFYDSKLKLAEGVFVIPTPSGGNIWMDLYNEERLKMTKEKTLHNSDCSGASKNVKDIVFFGDGDTFKLISKASSKAEGWMKPTKAMEIEGVGCVVQVTTQQGDNIAEALTFVPGVSIYGVDGNESNGRKLIKAD